MKTLPISFLHACLSYNPETGELRWRHRPREHFKTHRGWRVFESRYAGKPAGTVSKSTGYLAINFGGGDLYGAHRLAFAMHHGRWVEFIDHEDKNRARNAIDNIRECTRSQNQINRGLQSNNTSGHQGVSSLGRRWRASITHRRKTIHIGMFDAKPAAVEAYRARALELFGAFVGDYSDTS